MATNRKRSQPEPEVLSSNEGTNLIDFDDAPIAAGKLPIPLPQANEDDETFTTKLTALSDVVSKNRSLAVWTGFKATPKPQRDPLAIAKADAGPVELKSYQYFEACGRKPVFPAEFGGAFDVRKHVKALERDNNKTARRYEDMASCVDEVFGTKGATKENVCWIVANWEFILPLFKFLLRVKRARRNLNGGRAGVSENELAEYQTVRKIRSVLCARLRSSDDKRIRAFDAVLLKRQDGLSKILKLQQSRGLVMRPEPLADIEQPRVKRQRSSPGGGALLTP